MLYLTTKLRENLSTSKLISPFLFVEVTLDYKVTLARSIKGRLVKLEFMCESADDVLNKLAVQSNTDDDTFELISRLSVQIPEAEANQQLSRSGAPSGHKLNLIYFQGQKLVKISKYQRYFKLAIKNEYLALTSGIIS